MCPYFIHNFSQYVSHAKCSDWKLLEKTTTKMHFFTPNWPLVTLDNRTLFIKLVALHDVHSVLLVLFLSDIHKQHYCRKCLKFHLWPPITWEPGVRFTWESVSSTELIEVYHIPKIDQLLFRYLFSPKISIFCRIWPLPFWPCWIQKTKL